MEQSAAHRDDEVNNLKKEIERLSMRLKVLEEKPTAAAEQDSSRRDAERQQPPETR